MNETLGSVNYLFCNNKIKAGWSDDLTPILRARKKNSVRLIWFLFMLRLGNKGKMGRRRLRRTIGKAWEKRGALEYKVLGLWCLLLNACLKWNMILMKKKKSNLPHQRKSWNDWETEARFTIFYVFDINLFNVILIFFSFCQRSRWQKRWRWARVGDSGAISSQENM